MIDFHTHVLPGMDDGASDVEESLEMLRLSRSQGITSLVATSHYYAVEESPEDFLRRRKRAFEELSIAVSEYPKEEFPKVFLGAEVLFFPGMSDVASLRELKMANTPTILVEMPMEQWDSSMLSEVSKLGKNIHLIPILAHVDRYMEYLEDDTLIDKTLEHNFLCQVNLSFFLKERSREFAFQCLEEGKIHLLGSDCHNLTSRASHFHSFAKLVRQAGYSRELASLTEKHIAFLR